MFKFKRPLLEENQMENQKVSVIIPTYNLARYINETVDSVLGQTYKNYEIIIVDDGSTDNTKEALSEYGGKITYIFQENQGVSAARNKGIKEAKGEYIAFLDADDLWLKDKLELQIGLMNSNPEVAMIFTDGESFNEEGLIKASLRHSPKYLDCESNFGIKISHLNFDNYVHLGGGLL